MNKKRTFLTTKLAIGFITAIAVLGFIILLICQYYNTNSHKELFRKQALSCARSTASVLKGTNFENYLKNGKNEQYQEQLTIVNSICKYFGLKYLYVYIPDFENNKLTTIFYVDGTKNENIKNRDLATVIPWQLTKQEKQAFKGIESNEMFVVNNQMGHTITSFEPIYDNNNKITALVGADLDFNYVQKQTLFDILRILLFVAICLGLIYAVLLTYLRIEFLKPVIKISNKMSKFATTDKEDFTPLEVDRDDELGLMAQSYNEMLSDIQIYIKKISDTQMETIFSLAKLAQSRDDDTGSHLDRVQKYCRVLAEKLAKKPEFKDKIDKTFIDNLVSASTLHDIGKVGIPDNVLLKNGKLTDEEYEIIKKHTTIGYKTLKEAHDKFKSNVFIEMGMYIAHFHHERWDGKGYPTGIKGEQIPLEARIMAIADVYDALGTKRVYKPAFSQEKCIEIIKEGKGSQFDPVLVEAFLEAAPEFYEIRCSLEDKSEA